MCLPNPSIRAGCNTTSIFKRIFGGLKLVFLLRDRLPYKGWRVCPIIYPFPEEFISFPWVLTPCEMQTISSRIWTRVIVSIFYDGNFEHLSPLGLWAKCSPMAWKTGVQSQVESYLSIKRWYSMPPYLTHSCTVGWGCRIHPLRLCRGVRSSTRVSWIWH